MNRREFITSTCLSCATGALVNVLSSCGTARHIDGTLEGKGISVPRSEFAFEQKGKTMTRDFIIVHHDKLEFPIYLAHVDDQYQALWMKCTHQGSELNAGGDHLYCSSHGSEFDKTGKATHGPAERNLRSFPATVEGDRIHIELTKE